MQEFVNISQLVSVSNLGLILDISIYGRLHPLLVHLPIGIILTAFVIELLSWKERKYDSVIELLWILASLSSIISVLFGLMLAQSGQYEEALLDRHKWLGIACAITCMVVLYFWKKNNIKLYRIFLVLTTLLLSLAGHFGGSLTHGSDYLDEMLPWDTEVQADYVLDSSTLFVQVVHPILDSKCTSCHNSQKKKGQLILTHPEAILAGGENGPVIEFGSLEKSPMYANTRLSIHDKKHMPPKGKKQLTPNEIKTLKWWIESGVDFDTKLAGFNDIPDFVMLDRPVEEEISGNPLDSIAPVLKEMEETGIAYSLKDPQKGFVELNFGFSGDSISQNQLKQILRLSDNLVALDFGEKYLSDVPAEFWQKLPFLKELKLEKSSVSNEQLKDLTALDKLETLNLYGTSISNEGLMHLASLKSLKTLYLWNTRVDQAGIEQFKKSSQNVNIDL